MRLAVGERWDRQLKVPEQPVHQRYWIGQHSSTAANLELTAVTLWTSIARERAGNWQALHELSILRNENSGSAFQAQSCWRLRVAECGPGIPGRRTGYQNIARRYLIVTSLPDIGGPSCCQYFIASACRTGAGCRQTLARSGHALIAQTGRSPNRLRAMCP